MESIENIEEKCPVNTELSPEPSPAKKKRSVTEFLRQYRALGLPNAKRFRKRTRLEEAELTIALYKNALQHAAVLQGDANRILSLIAREENWAVHTDYVLGAGDEQKEQTRIEWVSDEDVMTDAQKFLKRFTPPTASISGPQQP